MSKELVVHGTEKFKQDYIDRTLTNLEAEATQEEQTIKAPEGYNGFDEVKVKAAKLQQKIVTPTKEIQQIKPDEGYYGLGEVIVAPPVIDGEAIIEAVNSTNEILSESYVGGNATHNDLLAGKVAYSQGKKVEGTIPTYDGASDIIVSSGEENNTTLYTKGKYMENNININVKDEELITPYHYFKNILDNDTTEGFECKCMYVFTDLIKLETATTAFYKNSSYPYSFRINNGELLTEGTYALLQNDENYIEMYDNNLKAMQKYIYMIIYVPTASKYSTTMMNVDKFYKRIRYIIEDEVAVKLNASHSGNTHLNLTRSNSKNVTKWLWNTSSGLLKYEERKIKVYSGVTPSNLSEGTEIDTVEYICGDDTEYMTIANTQFPSKVRKIICDKRFRLNNSYSSSQYNLSYDLLEEVIGLDFANQPSYRIESINPKLRVLKIYNIQYSMMLKPSGSSYNDISLLEVESILHTCKECWNTGSSRTLTLGTYNRLKIKDIYVKLIEPTSEMMEEDAYIGNKLPFIVCESTDEGAMTVEEYMVLKNWALA